MRQNLRGVPSRPDPGSGNTYRVGLGRLAVCFILQVAFRSVESGDVCHCDRSAPPNFVAFSLGFWTLSQKCLHMHTDLKRVILLLAELKYVCLPCRVRMVMPPESRDRFAYPSRACESLGFNRPGEFQLTGCVLGRKSKMRCVVLFQCPPETRCVRPIVSSVTRVYFISPSVSVELSAAVPGGIAWNKDLELSATLGVIIFLLVLCGTRNVTPGSRSGFFRQFITVHG